MIQMQHGRTHPTLKDVFVVDGNGMGTGNFYKSGLAVRVVREFEVADEKGAANRWVINPNRGYGTLGPQYALKLFNTDLSGTAYGWAMSDIDDPSVPRDIIGVYVDVAASQKNSSPRRIWRTPSPTNSPTAAMSGITAITISKPSLTRGQSAKPAKRVRIKACSPSRLRVGHIAARKTASCATTRPASI